MQKMFKLEILCIKVTSIFLGKNFSQFASKDASSESTK